MKIICSFISSNYIVLFLKMFFFLMEMGGKTDTQALLTYKLKLFTSGKTRGVTLETITTLRRIYK